MNEFALIQQYFAPLGIVNSSSSATVAQAGIVLGIGDDCALLRADGQELALTTDSLIEGRHFAAGADPYDIGWKALAGSLSDLAAMGAEPLAFLLSITLPEADDAWLTAFSAGLAAVASGGIALIGGNTTRGSLAVTTTAIGQLPPGAALRRDGARPGDLIAVTGTLGDAALALRLTTDFAAGGADANLNADVDANVKTNVQTGADLARRYLARRLHRPSPRIAAGLALRGVAHAAIDLSDGLAGDLGHILAASRCGADIRVDRLPMSPAFEALIGNVDRTDPRAALALQAAGGDDYELCVCLPESAMETLNITPPLTAIGRISSEPGLRWRGGNNRLLDVELKPYRHFG